MEFAEIENDYQVQYRNHYQAIFKEHIRGQLVKDLAEMMRCSVESIYNYLGGKVPDYANCKLLIESGIEILQNQGVEFEIFKSR